MNLDLDALQNTPNAIIRLSLPEQGRMFRSFIMDNLTIAGSANFTTPFEDAMQGGLDKVNNTAAAASIAMDTSAAMQYKSIGQTLSMYQSSDRPTFGISMIFLTTRKNQGNDQKAIELASMVYPETGAVNEAYASGNAPSGDIHSDSVGLTDQLKPPGNYRPVNGKPGGTWMLELGNWFRATELILLSSSLEVSKERVHGTDEALYSVVQCVLQPATAITGTMFRRYFRSRPGG